MSNAMLTDAKLRYLAEAAALGSMRAAGEKLDVAVSSISRQIAHLEAAVGVTLIERGRRSVKLTEAGELAMRYYRESIAQREALVSSLQALRGLHTGQIQLAVGEGFVNALTPLLQGFMTRYPGVLLSVNMAGSLDVMRQVRDDQAHLGLVFHSPADPKISVRASLPQPIKLIVHPKHPLAGASSVTLRQIAEHKLCLPEPSFRIRQMIGLAEASERVLLTPHVNTNSLHLLREMVKAGNCATLLPEIAAIIEINRKELVSVPVASRALQDTAANLICRLGRTLPSAAATFLPILEGSMRGLFKKTRA
jgi:DNA-binding transcriptional LysR family regulator